MLSIKSNSASLGAQRSLANATSSLQKAYERLSSGQRINKASDDAAGISVSSLLNSRARVFTQAVRNVNDGLSALAISDQALESLGGILTRQKELATQSANGVYSLAQRRAIQTEADALTNEYNRIVATTEFNGIRLLDGTNRSLRVQAGYGLDGSLNVASGQELLRTIGNGTFSSPTSGAYFAYTTDGAAGDFNGDGYLDIVRTENESSYRYFIETTNAQGTFQSYASFDTSSGGDRELRLQILTAMDTRISWPMELYLSTIETVPLAKVRQWLRQGKLSLT